MVDEIMTGAEVETAIAAPKVGMIHRLGHRIHHTDKIQNMLRPGLIMLAEDHAHSPQFVMAPAYLCATDLLPPDPEWKATDHLTLRGSRMKKSTPLRQNQ